MILESNEPVARIAAWVPSSLVDGTYMAVQNYWCTFFTSFQTDSLLWAFDLQTRRCHTKPQPK